MSLEGADAVVKPPAEPGLLARIYDAYSVCSNPMYRSALKGAYDTLWCSIQDFTEDPTDEALINLNGLWAHGTRILAGTPPEAGTPDPTSGDAEPARLAA
jgi:hypothetical protein